MQSEARNLIADISTNTHFHTGGLGTVAASLTGTKVGDPSADLVFNFAMLQCLKAMREEAKRRKLQPTLQWSGRRELVGKPSQQLDDFVDSSFVDDLALAVYAANASKMKERLRETIEMIDEIFAEIGFQLNYKKNKTEAIIVLRGEGATKVRKGAPHNELVQADPHLQARRHYFPGNYTLLQTSRQTCTVKFQQSSGSLCRLWLRLLAAEASGATGFWHVPEFT